LNIFVKPEFLSNFEFSLGVKHSIFPLSDKAFWFISFSEKPFVLLKSLYTPIFISSCFEKGVTKINIITGKGSRSKNLNDPYQSKDLSILKYSVPNFIKNNTELMEKILKIDFDSVNSPLKGNFDIILKKNK